MRRLLITFYSFKGGVGRTQALANVAVAMANLSQDVVVVDMDLESPGVHSFFSPEGDLSRRLTDADLATQNGVLEHIEHCQHLPEVEPNVESLLISCTHEHRHRGRLRLLPPGRLDDTYSERLARLSWERFYDEQDGYRYMELWRHQLFERAGADLVLLDSRTGLTDTGMVCTFQLPDIVVVLFALHDQGIEGARRLARAVARRRESEAGEQRLQQVLLIPSRVDDYGEDDLRTTWIAKAQQRLQDIPGCRLFWDLNQRIPYFPKVAYGEHVLDLEAGASPLTVAYKHLVEQIVALQQGDGVASVLHPPSPHAEPFLPALETTVANLKQGAETLVAEIKHFAPSGVALSATPRWAHDVVYQQALLRGELHRVEAQLERLDRWATSSVDEARRIPDPDTVDAWQSVPTLLDRWVNDALERFRNAVRAKLLAAVHLDTALLDEHWPRVEQLLATEPFEDISARLASLEEHLQRRALTTLLQRNALDPETFDRRIPSPEAQKLWLDARIQQIIDEGAMDRSAALTLWNLLRLRVGILDSTRSLSTQWNAYDIVCLLLRDDSEADRGAFRDVGTPMWIREWDLLFSLEDGPTKEVNDPAGVEGRAQLQRIALDQSELIAPIVATIVAGLKRQWPDTTRQQQLLVLFRKRRRDPCLTAAVLALAGDVNTTVQTGLLAAWLLECESFNDADRAALGRLLTDLVESGFEAEAFYALCASGRSDITVLDDSRYNFVYVAFLASLISKGKGEELLTRLLIDPEIGKRMADDRAGRGLLAIIAGGFGRDWQRPTEEMTLIRELLLYASGGGEPLPESVRSWLSHLRQQPSHDTSTAQKVGALDERIRQIGRRRIYASWEPSRHYERELDRFLTDEANRMRCETRPRSQVEPLASTAEQWIRTTYDELQGRGVPAGIPERDARRNIEAMFDEAREALSRMNDLRPEHGIPTLASLLAVDELRTRALAELRAWLSTRSGDGERGKIYANVANLLAEHTP
jgi:MinD-like ATPase involved in chromosome partitioning or flagellar assembly